MKLSRRSVFIFGLVLGAAYFLEVTAVCAARPDEKMLKANAKRRQAIENAQEKATPWFQALAGAIRQEAFYDQLPANAADVLTESILLNTFIATYKHYDEKKHTGDALTAWADEFRSAWTVLGKRCREQDLDQGRLAETIYQLTNSDWEPVTAGRNHAAKDDLATGAQYQELGEALIDLAVKAKAQGKDYDAIWKRLARSTKIGSAEDVRKINLNRLPEIPRW